MKHEQRERLLRKAATHLEDTLHAKGIGISVAYVPHCLTMAHVLTAVNRDDGIRLHYLGRTITIDQDWEGGPAELALQIWSHFNWVTQEVIHQPCLVAP